MVEIGKIKLFKILFYKKRKVILNKENRTCQVIDIATLGDSRVKSQNKN